MRSTFEQRFSELLDSLPGNDSDVAAQLGVSKQRLSSWRTGYRSPKKDMIEKIAMTFNASIPWLMGLDVPRTPFATPILPENLPIPPGTVHRVTVTHVPPAAPAPAVESAGGLDSIIAQLEALKAAQNAKPAQPTLSPREMSLLRAFRELPKRMQDKALRIIATLGDQADGL